MAGGGAAESVWGEEEGSKEERGGATPSDESKKAGKARPFRSPSELARVRDHRCAMATGRAAHYICIAFPVTAIAASFNASECVGCA